jgi:hypothetical protein
MIKVAMVKSNGEVAYTISPAVDDMYVDGETYNECIARHIDHNSDDQEVLNTWYWDAGWQTRDAATDDWHQWVNNAWIFASEIYWSNVRGLRDIAIAGSDWTQFPDSPLTITKKAEWTTYRQALRDIPETYSDATSLDDIIWPTKPE